MAAIYNMGRMLIIIAMMVYIGIYLTYKLSNRSRLRIKYLQALIEKDLKTFKDTGKYNIKISKKCGRLRRRGHKIALFEYLVEKSKEDEAHLIWIRQSGVLANYIKKKARKEFDQLFQLQCIEKFGRFEDQAYIKYLAGDKSFYIRTSRLKALAAIGASESLIEGMSRLKREEPIIEDRLLVEYLLHYKGDYMLFEQTLVRELKKQNTPLASALIGYFTLQKEKRVAECINHYLLKVSSNYEMQTLCMGYFEKVIYEPAEQGLIGYLTHEEEGLRALSARVLKQYGHPNSMLALEKALDDASYKVRENAAKSLYYRMSQKGQQIVENKSSESIGHLLEAVIADEAQLKAYMRAEKTRKTNEEVEYYRQFLLEQIR